MTRSEIIELMARAAPSRISDAIAEAMYGALTTAGLAIVPIEPSEAMMDAGSESHTEMPDDCAVIYRAMIAAAIKEQEGRD